MRLFDNAIFYWNNLPDAYNQAECYQAGRLVKQSLPRALALYQRAAQAGDARAYFRLGQHYQAANQWRRAFHAYYEAGILQHAETLSHLQDLANTEAEAALLLGKIYERLQRYTTAIPAYKKAHALKHPDGMYHVAQLFDHLPLTEKRNKEPADFYRESVKAGSKYGLDKLITLSDTSGQAAFYLARFYEIDLKQINRALLFYEKASRQGHGEATYSLGTIYAESSASIMIDIAKASRYYVTASHQGYSRALSALQSLAQQGQTEAQYVFAEYALERAQNKEAFSWFIQAELLGHRGAAQKLKESFSANQHWDIAQLYLDKSITHADTRWRTHCQKAADKGHPQAAFYLAQESEGHEWPHHRTRLLTSYNTAARLQNGEAQAAVQRFSNELIYAINNPYAGSLFQQPPRPSLQEKMKRK